MKYISHVRTICLLLLFALSAGCSKKCAPGQISAKGGKCIGAPLSEKVLNTPRRPPPKPRELAKKSPLAAPELKPLAALAPHVFGGKVPRWFESVDEVRQQTGLKDTRLGQNVAWKLGPSYSLSELRKIDEIQTQIDYFFMGDNLIAYDVSFYSEEEHGQKLAAAIRSQAEKAYGTPKSQDKENTDWILPHLIVHLAVTSPAQLAKARGHAISRVQISLTVTPDSIKQDKVTPPAATP
jgi:hypothetical protein